jgi:hypothetical protein
MLKPNVGQITLMSSPLNFFRMVVFPALSRPLFQPNTEQSNRNMQSFNALQDEKSCFLLLLLDFLQNCKKPHVKKEEQLTPLGTPGHMFRAVSAVFCRAAAPAIPRPMSAVPVPFLFARRTFAAIPSGPKPFKVLGIQQVAIGGPSKAALSSLWVDIFGCTKTSTFRSERENVDEDILTLGKGPYAVEIDLMEPINPEKVTGFLLRVSDCCET